MTGNTNHDDAFPTPHDQLLYLLFELERAVERERIDWSTADSDSIHRRLLRLAQMVAPTSTRSKSGAGRSKDGTH